MQLEIEGGGGEVSGWAQLRGRMQLETEETDEEAMKSQDEGEVLE